MINPRDFRQSAESIYHLSFLIRNGTCALRVADNEEPMVCQAVPPTHQEHANGVNRTQMIMEFNMATGRWMQREVRLQRGEDHKLPGRALLYEVPLSLVKCCRQRGADTARAGVGP
ncbi:hypothetical protein DFJ58DRAFT_891741 [Suillus subalutaceus]|uniref:uncharacterized protein n=1 Tax=Suillus subalutaceus TaxID=48586 RepID=UPI001B872CF0|nr:uncharacterized protein DFJ58DRAFT_891741 [Suillus subalutaceus]KAG1847332.1 hypothetical protein DFJ58DRAFT_891741 [Suillus subalutaceus]